MLNSTNKTRCT